MATKKTLSSSDTTVPRADIEKRAKEIYEKRVQKNLSGNAESDWLAAEKELSGKKK